MIIGLGIDIADQIRIKDGLEKHKERFLTKLFTPAEIAICDQYRYQVEHYAGKFAVKEAFMKAISSGHKQGVHFLDIEVLNHESGAPYIIAHGKAKQIADTLGVLHTHVTLSHSADIAAAVVVLEK